jgi:RNA polymerase sigma factor (sigma-70 family)
MLDNNQILTNSKFASYLTGVAKSLDSPALHGEKWTLTQEAFDQLLAWMDSNRENAARKYEEIRSGLIKGFDKFGCKAPEDLADETINRVARKLPEIKETYVGECSRYFYAVAHNVHREYLRKPKTTSLPETDLPSTETPPDKLVDEVEQEYACLEHCMEQLTPQNREIIMQYYQGEKQQKIRQRKELALRQGMNLAALRLRAQRIRDSLRNCILNCLEREILG